MTHPHAHILQAIIDGKTVQGYSVIKNMWSDLSESDVYHLLLCGGKSLRIKPATVTINGVELEDDRLKYGDPTSKDGYFAEQPYISDFCSHHPYPSNINETTLERGLLHHTKEGAIAFCKARLGIKD